MILLKHIKLKGDDIKGVILAGGSGKRLYPLTKVTNKTLLPIYNKPMIYYPIKFLVSLDIKDIILIINKRDAGEFIKLLEDGSDLGVNITYIIQKKPLGIAHALSLVKNVINNENLAVVLGDNIFDLSNTEKTAIKQKINKFINKAGATIFIKKAKNLNSFGVPVFNENKKIIKIEEKPKKPKSEYGVTGFYLYDNTVFDKIRKLKPSKRGELEITDVNNMYLINNKLDYFILKSKWIDTGTFESLHLANKIARYKKL